MHAASSTRSRLAARTAAVVVVYRPDRPLEGLLQQLAAAVARVVLVDNAETPDPRWPALAQRTGVELIAAGNVAALAGAYNRALAHLRQPGCGGFDQVVLLDDDSDASVLGRFLDDALVTRLLASPHTAAVAPAYRDRATGLRGRYIELDRWRLRYMDRQFSGLREVAFVINSMSVWRRDALERIGPFDETLALDHVDTDYCLRARALGLSVSVHGGHEFEHSIGHRRRYRFLGRELQAGGHAPVRRWLIARNTLLLARRWALREPAFGFLCLTRLAYEAIGILAAEDCKAAKLAALARGAWSGLVGRAGP